jgi:quercetin dioxygenase-like cupin family protein
VRVVRLGAVPRRPVEAHGSIGFTVGALGLTADAHLVVVSLRAGGVIGRHPAAGRQMMVVVEGDAQVSGADGSTADLGPGDAAVWEPGEAHETRSRSGLTAFVVEGDVQIGASRVAVDPT